MTKLKLFAPRSRLSCCATCVHWTLRRMRRPHVRPITITWCPIAQQPLPDDLAGCGCADWRKETRESYAIEFYDELERELGGLL